MAPYVMTIAGLDPSAGAGLTADIKTFEAHGVYGFGVCSALTVQTDDHFYSVEWLPAGKIVAQATPLLEKFPVSYCKIGIMQSVATVQKVITALRIVSPQLRFVLDPVLKASAGFSFYNESGLRQWQDVLSEVELLTPNYHEAQAIGGDDDGDVAAAKLAQYTAVLLKGGIIRSYLV
ncbi:bifunctional hydroxymethylpyrimidine kinase/phosphomethylpyrimidine kinase [Chitinophaga horti]|uniref:Bifunctional hydroxymethylpyrimidine kinase/phosphomethylpyrimidine kinase n=1 Tax=Chitinophaga horti TaxID=2920382 RepID=A0ABY6J287_9BACT|nr:bifunctional hydroxymethylpyrimidine kinase/phosphomethylpyrimidine kinase [Chitinophaga horti]UYQ92767.1 bifunctional hydroxymethylpyrimidine kinase/phosphomethylpyrimidine kinase [Chitinophaga horti]